MNDKASLDAESPGQTFQSFLEKMSETAPVREGAFIQRLRAHFGGNPAELPVLTEDYRVPVRSDPTCR